MKATMNPFESLLTAYANDPNNTAALTDLAKAVTFSVLKKLRNVGGAVREDTPKNKARYDNMPSRITRELAKDLTDLDRIAYATANAYETTYTADGDRVQKIKSKDLDRALTDLCKSSLGDGLDLVHDAVVAILAETAKQINRDPEKPVDLERPYTERRLKKKVWIKSADSVNGWETVETTPIQEVYKAVRRSIQNNRSFRTDPRNSYTYIEDISTDPETDVDTVIYRRFGKYADIGGYETDTNGKETFYTADLETVKDIDTLVDSLHLTPRQAEVLSLRQSGYGYKAIAAYLGVTQRAIAKTVKAIQDKAVAVGLNPAETR